MRRLLSFCAFTMSVCACSSTATVSGIAASDVCSDADCSMGNIEIIEKRGIKDIPLTHDVKFGVALAQIDINTFNQYGFEFGDSVDIRFSTGYEMIDVPYYNGFYVKTGESLLVGYPGKHFLYAGYNDSDDVWILAGLDENATAVITLNQKGKYRTVQEAFNLVYSDDRNHFASDEEFANYRPMTGGRLKQNVFFRSASPCDDQHHRAAYVDALMEKDNIQFVLNFSDNEGSVSHHMNAETFNSPFFAGLYQKNRVALLDLSSNYRKFEFKQRVAASLIRMLEFDGPYLAHCVEGKDRTGFISILMEGLCSASYEEMKSDYMKSYEIYYQITKNNRAGSYDSIVSLLFDPMLVYLSNESDAEKLAQMDYSKSVQNYLKDGGMSDDQIHMLMDRICD